LSYAPGVLRKRGNNPKDSSWWGVTDINEMIQKWKQLHSKKYATFDFISQKEMLYVVSFKCSCKTSWMIFDNEKGISFRFN